MTHIANKCSIIVEGLIPVSLIPNMTLLDYN